VASLVGPGGLAPDTRGLIVAGAGCGARADVERLSRRLGWPLLADPRSGVRTLEPTVVAAADGLLRSERFADRHRPEFVLRLGERWVSKVVNQFLAGAVAAGARSVAVEPWGRWIDPEHDTTEFVRADPSYFCRQAADLVGEIYPEAADVSAARAWGHAWASAEARAREVLAGELDGRAGGAGDGDALSEPALARWLVAHLPATATLVVSSSMPVRDVEAFAAPRAEPPRLLANRGANGIDGVVSTALGVALAGGGPTVALVGDLAFLHDVSALVRSPGFTAPLTVVVADNAGGGIFSFLAPAAALDPGQFDTLFGTPQASEVAAVATGFGWPVEEVEVGATYPSLDRALDRRLGGGGLGVIRVALPGRTENVARHDRLNAAVVEAVEGGMAAGRG
jgi:2-succinyl-5-enolpyruvyl-6-hydroxy-3-cyclohexene-1-carboxylate synthase